MSDYIEREAALALVEPDARPFLAERISQIPAADVRPVVKGEWIEREDMYYGWNVWECSACHEEFCVEEGTPADNQYNFCPNCGAKMEAGE